MASESRKSTVSCLPLFFVLFSCLFVPFVFSCLRTCMVYPLCYSVPDIFFCLFGFPVSDLNICSTVDHFL